MQPVTINSKAQNTKRAKKTPAGPKETKGNKILALLRRSSGATITQLSKATNWQAHSIRGFLSGTVKKRMGLSILSEKNNKGIRRYRIASTEDT